MCKDCFPDCPGCKTEGEMHMLKPTPEVLARINDMRRANGLPPLGGAS